MRIPHPIPYQGSKRRLAPRILPYMPCTGGRLIEPFAGSAAVTLAAAAQRAFSGYLIGDAFEPLARLWRLIVSAPLRLATEYEQLWRSQLDDPRAAYNRIRAEFNATGEPARLLYLLARCVKGAIRFNAQGEFNQSPDNRRLGMRPASMRRQVLGAHSLLRENAAVLAGDFREATDSAVQDDVVYMDPPYEGVRRGRDERYYTPLNFTRADLLSELARLNAKGVPFLLSYDGTCGDREYGRELPPELDLERIPIRAGRSAQSTLSGRAEVTVESLYVSRAAREALGARGSVLAGLAVARLL